MTHNRQPTTKGTRPMKLRTQTARIEMLVPDDIDPSDLLARMQEFAIELADEYADEEEEDDATITTTELENAVSVQIKYVPRGRATRTTRNL